jgi:hypothetical protein
VAVVCKSVGPKLQKSREGRDVCRLATTEDLREAVGTPHWGGRASAGRPSGLLPFVVERAGAPRWVVWVFGQSDEVWRHALWCVSSPDRLAAAASEWCQARSPAASRPELGDARVSFARTLTGRLLALARSQRAGPKEESRAHAVALTTVKVLEAASSLGLCRPQRAMTCGTGGDGAPGLVQSHL